MQHGKAGKRLGRPHNASTNMGMMAIWSPSINPSTVASVLGGKIPLVVRGPLLYVLALYWLRDIL